MTEHCLEMYIQLKRFEEHVRSFPGIEGPFAGGRDYLVEAIDLIVQ